MSEQQTTEIDAHKSETWRTLLEPWGNRLAALENDIEAHCEGLDDQALNALGLACNRPTQTNCYWASYQVAPMVRSVVRRQQYARQQARQTKPIPPGSSVNA